MIISLFWVKSSNNNHPRPRSAFCKRKNTSYDRNEITIFNTNINISEQKSWYSAQLLVV